MTWWQWLLIPAGLAFAWLLWATIPSLITYMRMRRM